MAKIFVCNPEYYGIQYEINPWMSVKNQADRDLAILQWNNLVQILKDIGCEILEMPGHPKLPDIVFTANAGAVVKNKVVLANFRYPERQPEKEVYKKWLTENKVECIELSSSYFEGAGDCLANNARLFFGSGFRSDSDVCRHSVWQEYYQEFYTFKLVDPYFYHLDTCFCPLKNDCALIYPPAFEDATVEGLKLLIVPKEEAVKFACNAVCIDDNVVIPSGCPETRQILEEVGFKVYDTDMSEFIKAGGACKCLTLRLD